jgi:endoglycosylceramidase
VSRRVIVVVAAGVLGLVGSACGGTTPSTHTSSTSHGASTPSTSTPSTSPNSQAIAADPDDGPVGPISAPGGPFLYDADGRVVLFHGVDLVYKVAPYEVEVTGSGPNVLETAEVEKMASLGFDAVRLGIIWTGLDPGTDPINDPAICSQAANRPGSVAGTAADQFNGSIFDAYINRLDATISMLAKYGIYSLLDMHQDVYSDVFAGEGAPDWAVCTDGIKPKPVRNIPNWSDNLTGPGVIEAYENFWMNDVVGNLQGQFDQVWAKVASHFKGNPWILGYDPFNEPYGTGLKSGDDRVFDSQLQCFFMGTADPGRNQEGQSLDCPPDDPTEGLIPQIEAADPTHLVFYDTDYSVDSGPKNYIGPMSEPRLVLNFHDYCFLHVPNGPEPADFGKICAPLENLVFEERSDERANDATTEQPGGPAWFLTEFGASTDTQDLGRIAADANSHLVSWMYWQWIHYDDPTGSHTSGLWPPGPATQSQLEVLSQTYARAIAGIPLSTSFDTTDAHFAITYRANDRITEPTVIFVPIAEHYPHGYCPNVTGGRVTSSAGSEDLDIVNDPDATDVTVSVVPGSC